MPNAFQIFFQDLFGKAPPDPEPEPELEEPQPLQVVEPDPRPIVPVRFKMQETLRRHHDFLLSPCCRGLLRDRCCLETYIGTGLQLPIASGSRFSIRRLPGLR